MAEVGIPLECGKAECDVVFIPTRWNQKYCETHRTKPNVERYAYLRTADRLGSLDRRCELEGCARKILGKRAADPRTKYCTDKHARAAAKKRDRQRKRDASATKIAQAQAALVSEDKLRSGDVLRMIDESGDAVSIDNGLITAEAAAEIHGVTPAAISRAMGAWRYLREKAEHAAGWSMRPLVRAMLPTNKLLRIRELGLAGHVESDEFQCLADELVRAYSVFSRWFFELEGNRPLIKDFHLRWIRSIIVAYAIGGKQLILSPPRHGKSEVMIRFVVWLIVMFPNIRIVWVAANTDVAKIMLGAVKDHLVNNEKLVEATLPPGESYRPPRSMGRPWSNKEIKVRQQTHVGAKSSSMLALGATSKILSRDMDLLIVDDLEDFDSTEELAQRKKTKKRFAEYGTRKEEKTAWVDIGSRQHPDDVSGALLRGKMAVGAWRVIVDTAHAEDCDLDPEEIAGHDESGCMLFPEVRSYRWLMEKKGEMDTLGVVGAYEMRYLNRPLPTEGIVFNVDLIRDRALDRSRDVGLEELPAGRLIAGLDPASRGMQAAFLWHFLPNSLSMVDLEMQKAGGFQGAMDIMRDWNDRYGLTDWYYEDNSQQDEFFRDPRVKELKLELALTIKPHTTGKNKQDPELGISSMAPWYHSGRINLPYGTAEAKRKVNLLLGQLELWTSDGIVRGGKNAKTDIKMASWFPFPRIVRWNRIETIQTKTRAPVESSYPAVNRISQVSWSTPYPRG